MKKDGGDILVMVLKHQHKIHLVVWRKGAEEGSDIGFIQLS